MNHHEILNPLVDIFARVQGLVQLAQAEDWTAMEAAAIEYEQRVAILGDATYFKSISAANVIEEAKAIIIQIQMVNSELDAYTAVQREKIASELRQITQSTKALDAYSR